MLKAINVNNQFKFVSIYDSNYKDCRLCLRDELLLHSCMFGDIPEDIMILTQDMIIRIEDGWMYDILEV